MAEKSTFIKIDRNITEWGWYRDTNTKVVFLHLLIMASYKDREYAGIELKRGEYVTTYERLADSLNLSVRQVRTALEHLKATGEVTIKRHSKFQVISIKNYDFYQSDYENRQSNDNQMTIKSQSFDNQMTVNRQSNDNQMTIKQECKEGKECKESEECKECKESDTASPTPTPEKKQKEVKHKFGEYGHVRLTDNQYQNLIADYGESRIKLYIKKVDEYCQQHGKSYKDYNLTIRNWMNKDNVQKVNGQSRTVYDEYEDNQDLPF